MLRKAVGKGAYEMAYSQQENALWVATSQSRSLDKGGIVYRLDPTTLEVTQIIHNDLKPSARRSITPPRPCGLAIPPTAPSPLLMPKPGR
jgi:DNA-binding beta-propeller fold protein YncE